MRRSIIPMALAAIIAAIAPPNVATAQVPQGEAGPREIDLKVGRNMVITPPWPVARVSVARPEVADVQVVSPREVLLMGISLGVTDLLMWSEDGRMIERSVSVEADLSYITDELERHFPSAALSVEQSREVVIIAGNLRRVEDVEKMHALLDSLDVPYVDMTRVAGVQQVQLKVRVAEVSRSALKALTFNWFFSDDNFFIGSQVGPGMGGAVNPISIGPPEGASTGSSIPFLFSDDVLVNPAVTIFGGFPNVSLAYFLQALAENQYLRILAEPTLTALSGEEASFLAGGEFPIPIVQGSTAGGGTSITIEYREFGVRLKFRPVVLGNNTIRLFVAPEVSDLSPVGAVEIQGFQIPALVVRKSSTTVELQSGQSIVMAGLLQQSTRNRVSRIPVLGDLPILGTLFRSTRYERSETELVVLVTASLVEPIDAGSSLPVPGLAYVPPNDWELFVEGRIASSSAPELSPSDRAWLERLNIDRLVGPGAWVDHDDPLPPDTTYRAEPRDKSPAD